MLPGSYVPEPSISQCPHLGQSQPPPESSVVAGSSFPSPPSSHLEFKQRIIAEPESRELLIPGSLGSAAPA
ncbi:hypothetical protein LZ30DRAFT_473071 [Colletotrichum cereale]|nr:hypothetical protein LZ30DRAFT_473071 [Colletotrichum cereale]